jgi:hypothetical protein
MIRVNVSPSVTAFFGNCPDPQVTEGSHHRENYKQYADCKILLQVPAPVVVAPPSLNVTELGTQMLKLFGFKEDEARKFSESIDWTTTLVVPLPIDHRMDVTDVDVNGVKGHLFVSREHGPETPAVFNLLWIRDGILYSFMGRGNTEDALAFANSL